MVRLFLPSSCCEHCTCRQAAASFAAKVREQLGGAQRPQHIVYPVTFATSNATTMQQCLILSGEAHPFPGELWLQLEGSALVRVAGTAASHSGWGHLSWQVDAHRRIARARGASTAFFCPGAQCASGEGTDGALAVLTSRLLFTCLETVRACKRPKRHGCATWGTAASSMVDWKWKLWPSPMLCVGEVWGLSAPVQGCQMVVIQAEQRLPPNGGHLNPQIHPPVPHVD